MYQKLLKSVNFWLTYWKKSRWPRFLAHAVYTLLYTLITLSFINVLKLLSCLNEYTRFTVWIPGAVLRWSRGKLPPNLGLILSPKIFQHRCQKEAMRDGNLAFWGKYRAISRKWYKIGIQSLWMTNRKSYVVYRIMTLLMTVTDSNAPIATLLLHGPLSYLRSGWS